MTLLLSFPGFRAIIFSNKYKKRTAATVPLDKFKYQLNRPFTEAIIA